VEGETDIVAVLLRIVPKLFSARNRNSELLSETCVMKEYVSEFAPLTTFHVVPESSLRSHVNVGWGFPLADALKLALVPE
jgi:RAB protein geranylgeranyltransferase component A